MNKEFFKRTLSTIVLLPCVIFIVLKGYIFFNFFLILCFSISVYEWIKMSPKKMSFYAGIIFLILSFFSIYQVRFHFDHGLIYLFLILFICISTDLGGYICGKLLKGPKLTKISPNKTYSGMIGSFIFPIILIYILSSNSFFENLFNVNMELFLFIVIVSLVSQLGDIIISYFKRISNIKDTGNIIPGHGGLLDRIDGMVFAFPFSYIFISLIDVNFIK